MALRSPRSKRASAQPLEFTNEEMVYMINSFGRDFNVGHVDRGGHHDLDAAERRRLGRLILELLDRYALADVVYRSEGDQRVAVRVRGGSSKRTAPSISPKPCARGGAGTREASVPHVPSQGPERFGHADDRGLTSNSSRAR